MLRPAANPWSANTPDGPRWRKAVAATLAAIMLMGSTGATLAQTRLIEADAYKIGSKPSFFAAAEPAGPEGDTTAAEIETDPFDYFQRQLDYGAAPPTEPDGEGLWSDTKYFFFYQFFIIGVLYAMPESTSNWSKDQKEQDRVGAYRDNLRAIVWDEDDHSVNFIGHPYFGSLYYARARERGYSQSGAFWYAAGLSATYEFGVEALFEKPSIQDLVTTPVLGTLLGYWFEGIRNNIRKEALANGKFSATDKFILVATDLLGYMNSYADRWFGGGKDTETEVALTAPFGGTSITNRPLGLWVSVRF